MAPPQLQRLDYVILLCRDLQAARSFYLDVLGFHLVEDYPVWVRFDVGGTFLTLRPRGNWRSWQDGDIPASTASVQLAFRVACDAVSTWHEHLLQKQVTIIEEPADQDFGHRTLFFYDLDQNVIEIFAELSQGR